MAGRVSQDAPLVLGEGSPQGIVSQDAPLVLAEGSPRGLVSQVAVLVLIDAAINPAQYLNTIFVST